jgi:hypothetical protein
MTATLSTTAPPRASRAAIYGDAANRPVAIPPSLDGIPEGLRQLPRWVGWRFELRKGKWSKVPTALRTGRNASSTDPTTWASFDEARATYDVGGLDGVGICLGDGLLGVDLDDCRDPATGQLAPWATEVVERLATYTEVSPSGTGVKMLGFGSLPAGVTRKPGAVEAYDAGRYFCVTGVALPHSPPTPVKLKPAALAWLVASYLTAPAPSAPAPKPVAAAKPTPTPTAIAGPDVERIWASILSPLHKHRAMLDALIEGTGFEPFLKGDTSGSAALLSLCDKVAVDACLLGIAPTRELIEPVVGRTKLAAHPKWSREDFRRRTIEAAIRYATELADIPPPAPSGSGSELVTLTLSACKPKPIAWLVHERVPAGMLWMIAGPGGRGKSTIAYHLAAALSRGECAFGLSYPKPVHGRTLLIGCEDNPERVILPRLLALGADTSQVECVQGVRAADGTVDFGFQHLAALRAKLGANPEIRFVVFDPVSSFVARAGRDEHKDGEVRSILDPLAALAAEFGVSVLIIKHLNKNSEATAVDRIGGSAAFANAVRVAYVVGTAPNCDDGSFILTPVKADILPDFDCGLRYRLVGCDPLKASAALMPFTELGDDDRAALVRQMSCVEWLGAASVVANDLHQAPTRDAKPGKVDAADAAVVAALGVHAWPSKELDEAMSAAGIAGASLRAAKERLSALPLTDPRSLQREQRCDGKTKRSWWVWLGPRSAPTAPPTNPVRSEHAAPRYAGLRTPPAISRRKRVDEDAARYRLPGVHRRRGGAVRRS